MEPTEYNEEKAAGIPFSSHPVDAQLKNLAPPMPENLILKSLTSHDEPHLWPMFRLAAHERDLATVRSNPDLIRYVAGWARPGDFGYGAFCDEDCIGAAWCRLWREDNHGFGFVSESIPELAIAVVSDWRAHGLGTRLIEAVLLEGRELYPGISLNVRDNSPAVRLYERLGFVRLPGSDVINRTGGLSFTMLRRFH